jgi:hypothetical protein
MSFPQRRFVEAGATPQELARFQGEYDALSPDAQEARAAELAGVAEGDLVELLALSRETAAGEEGESEPGPEPDTVLGVVDPPAVDDGEDEAEDESTDASTDAAKGTESAPDPEPETNAAKSK